MLIITGKSIAFFFFETFEINNNHFDMFLAKDIHMYVTSVSEDDDFVDY